MSPEADAERERYVAALHDELARLRRALSGAVGELNFALGVAPGDEAAWSVESALDQWGDE